MSQGQSLSRGRFAADVALAVVLTLFILGATGRTPPDAGEKSLDWLAYTCIVVAGGSLALRRRVPLAVVTAVTGALLVYTASDYVGGTVYVTGLVALYSLATQRPRRLAFAIAALLAFSLLIVAVAVDRWESLIHLLLLGYSAAAVFLGTRCAAAVSISPALWSGPVISRRRGKRRPVDASPRSGCGSRRISTTASPIP
jgi:hypothetical protein